MGSEDSTKNQAYQKTQIKCKLKILLLIIVTNILTIFIVTGSYSNLQDPISRFSKQFSLPIWDSTTTLLIKLNATEDDLVATRFELENLGQKLKSANSLIKTLSVQLSRVNIDVRETSKEKHFVYDDLLADISDEAKLSLGSHKLPLGFTPQMGSDKVYPSVGGACLKHKDDLSNYMSYVIGGDCPVDDVSAQKLMLKGCEPLPRRRCHPKSPVGYIEPTPLPESMWSIPPDTSLVWDPYTCKNYQCLVDRTGDKARYDCKDCFHLQGREKTRWLFDNGGIDYGIDQILGLKPRGTIRIGLDIGGGTGTFAARMKERNVTIITTSMNFDGPFNSFIASRGLVPMHVTISQRFPFFDNTLDIIHSMHVLSNWIPESMLEFILYDIYRILRPGGLFWVDRFFCLGLQLNATYVPLFDRVGFRKVRWNVGRKMDRGIEKNEWYFSALLEKPKT
ncbi:putative methyltransferase At1g29790 [Primulina tabacum]|uniref:putative methyltransferase At1g29790 n=1 Tax=Primulina tabacum TaxID=48773 RepID=UPI003F5A4074